MPLPLKAFFSHQMHICPSASCQSPPGQCSQNLLMWSDPLFIQHTHVQWAICFWRWEAVVGVELRALCSQSRYSTTWSTSPVHFFSGYFWDERSRELFVWANLQLQSSQLVRIISMGYWHPAMSLFLMYLTVVDSYMWYNLTNSFTHGL
jgi:hypothetical protein